MHVRLLDSYLEESKIHSSSVFGEEDSHNIAAFIYIWLFVIAILYTLTTLGFRKKQFP